MTSAPRWEEGVALGSLKADYRSDKFCEYECEHLWMVPKCNVSFFSARFDPATCSRNQDSLWSSVACRQRGGYRNKGGGKIPMAPMCWAQMLSKIQPQTEEGEGAYPALNRPRKDGRTEGRNVTDRTIRTTWKANSSHDGFTKIRGKSGNGANLLAYRERIFYAFAAAEMMSFRLIQTLRTNF